jgi:predicted Rossmann fold flavoprotein
MNKVIIIGGGAAGLVAGISARGTGADVVILEKMPKVGRKLLITGKGRCNITNKCSIDELIKNIPGNGRFLYSAFQHFTNDDMINLLEKNGLATKVERGNRVFPQSDKAMDVVDTLRKIFLEAGGEIFTNHAVTKIKMVQNKIVLVECGKKASFTADAFVLATGGASYPGTGSTGDGYRIAQELGHTIVPLRPSLVPLDCPPASVKALQNLALKNVTASLLVNGKIVGKEFGEMSFTDFGVTGPIILSLSEKMPLVKEGVAQKIALEIDLKPALSEEQLDNRVQRDFKEFSRKHLANGLSKLLPMSMIPEIIKASQISPDKEINQITKAERQQLVQALKHFTLTITGVRPIAEAIVTAGGISLKEVNPKTLASKLISNLFLAGEVLDINGYTGGFNLQAAFSSGYVAGESAGFLAMGEE